MKISLRQLKQLIKEEVNKTMLLESEEATMINPLTGWVIKVNDQNEVTPLRPVAEGTDSALIGYEEWAEQERERRRRGVRRKREEPSGPRTGLFRSRADDMEVDW